MSDLEQRIKEAAEKAIITGLASQGKRHLGVEYLSAHTALEDFEQLITPESIKALLAEKDAALESLKRDLESTDEALEAQVIKYENCPHEMVVGVTCACSHDAPSDVCSVHAPQLRKAQEELESLKARAEQLEQIAREFRKDKTGRHGWHGEFVDINGPETCDICKAYDALSGPREGEQDAGN